MTKYSSYSPVDREKPIRDMLIGEAAYTMYWAMSFDCHGQPFIRGDYPAFQDKFGTADMLVHKTFFGYIVDVSGRRADDWGKGHYEVKGGKNLKVTRILGLSRLRRD